LHFTEAVPLVPPLSGDPVKGMGSEAHSWTFFLPQTLKPTSKVFDQVLRRIVLW
jgi:hypothetical protein